MPFTIICSVIATKQTAFHRNFTLAYSKIEPYRHHETQKQNKAQHYKHDITIPLRFVERIFTTNMLFILFEEVNEKIRINDTNNPFQSLYTFYFGSDYI